MRYQAIDAIRLKTPVGRVELSAGQSVLLEPERALKLVEMGKLKPLGQEANIEDFCALCSKAIDRINDTYYPKAYGWIGWTKEHNPKLWADIEEAERSLESPLDRRISFSEFARLVDHWEALYRHAVELFLTTYGHQVSGCKE